MSQGKSSEPLTRRVKASVNYGRLSPDDPRHGSASTYRNHGCRCDACKKANTRSHLEWSHRRGYHKPRAEWLAEIRLVADSRHDLAGYSRGCRCDICRKASADYQRDYRARLTEERREQVRANERERKRAQRAAA